MVGLLREVQWCSGVSLFEVTRASLLLCHLYFFGHITCKTDFFRIRKKSLTASQKNPPKLYVERFSICVLKFLYIKAGRFAATFCPVPDRNLQPLVSLGLI